MEKNEYLKKAKKTWNDGYYRVVEDLVNDKGEEFAEYAMRTHLVDYPVLTNTNLTGLDLVDRLLASGVTLEEAEKKMAALGMDDFIAYAKEL